MEKNDKKIKFTEKLSHGFRKRWLVNGVQLALIIAVLFVAYYCLYLFLEEHDLPEFDITTNKLHTLSETSKEVLSQIDKDIEILVYGYPESSDIFNLLKQYHKVNEKITSRRISEETDLEYITNHSLSTGYYVVIIRCGDDEKILDASDFAVYDSTIYQNVDITEQKITNSLLDMVVKDKIKVCFTEGHQEYTASELATIDFYLTNEAFETETININLDGAIPEDCNILAIIGPQADLSEQEVEIIKNFISKGGSLFVSRGVLADNISMPNLQIVLDEYGVTLENGFILEYDEDKGNPNYPFVFVPQVSEFHEITSKIFTDGYVTLAESARITFKDDTELENLKVTKEVLLNSSENSTFINDLSSDSIANASMSAYTGKSNIAASLEKTVGTNKLEDGTEEKVVSKLVVIASSSYMTETYSQFVSSTYPLVRIGSNKDFTINAMSYLGNKDYYLTIRKDYAYNTYAPTTDQNRIVLTIIFSVPLFILVAGFVIWNYRKKRK